MQTDRDRLIELLKETEEHPEKTCPHYLEADCFDCPYDRGEDCDREARKADYLLANGVIVPPCKVGDLVYALWSVPTETKYIVYCAEVKKISQYKRNYRLTTIFELEPIEFRGRRREYRFDDFGKTVFLTREEAERKLKERDVNC